MFKLIEFFSGLMMFLAILTYLAFVLFLILGTMWLINQLGGI